MTLETDLARLDREWEDAEVRHWSGAPNLTMRLLGGVVLAMTGGMLIAHGKMEGVLAILFGAATTVVACLAARQFGVAQQRFEADRKAYKRQRKSLLHELSNTEKAPRID